MLALSQGAVNAGRIRRNSSTNDGSARRQSAMSVDGYATMTKLFQRQPRARSASPVLGDALRARGCLWNSFVIVAYPSTLIALCRRALPSLVDEFLRIRPALTAPCESAR